MDARLQQRIQRYGWDRAAAVYQEAWQAQLAPAQRLLLELAAPAAGEAVLDVACGTGLVSLPAAQAVGPAGRLLGCDISGAMVEAAAEEAAAAGLAQAEFRRVAGETLDFGDEDDRFDLALCSLGLMYMAEPDATLAAMARALKPGGRCAVLVWGERRNCGWAELFPIVDRRVASEVCPLFFRLGTGDALHRSLKEAGFARIATRRLTCPLHFADGREAVVAAIDGGAVALAVARFDEETYAATAAEYLESLAPWRNGKGYDVPGEFVVAVGHKGA
jgi:ubiquinone/menaquinone biosynthesis C-methylase UbiE